jgi:ribosomal protein S18 acetylase RimI-like enzyme
MDPAVRVIQIRDAVSEDVPAIARLHARVDWDTYSALFGPAAYALEPAESEQRWRQALRDGDTLLVATDKVAIIGFGQAQGDRIGALYLHHSYQRRGIGSTLLLRLLAKLATHGNRLARLDVAVANQNAIAFYRRHGAIAEGRTIHYDPRGNTENIAFVIPIV